MTETQIWLVNFTGGDYSSAYDYVVGAFNDPYKALEAVARAEDISYEAWVKNQHRWRQHHNNSYERYEGYRQKWAEAQNPNVLPLPSYPEWVERGVQQYPDDREAFDRDTDWGHYVASDVGVTNTIPMSHISSKAFGGTKEERDTLKDMVVHLP